jgi:hypothetical protein
VHIFYAADVNQLADESEVMGIGEPEKAKKERKIRKVGLCTFVLNKVVLNYYLTVA